MKKSRKITQVDTTLYCSFTNGCEIFCFSLHLGVKNPVQVAENLLTTQMAGTMSLGRIPPGTMVGDGAREWAFKVGIPIVGADALKTGANW